MARLMDMLGGGVTPMMVEQAAPVQSSAKANSISLDRHLDAAASPWRPATPIQPAHNEQDP